MRITITLACSETGDRNYTTTKNKRNNPERIEKKKYSSRLKKYTIHREAR
ncbi:50S ribosomal protein L33 [Paenibacillus psychroresistens]|uniref:Large ribosomal subunit protein bL33 n=1 Tax=Paenibacillus psychroresistens TaxID=1778678 RepID=A0A6B8RM43_9BACL|nr:50S ribosomal protein L33 [Paenibacillus psychroresistens]QGQ96408.1 50S ribosomal protein L33 [Paenibacillus psychroresistens]